MVARMMDTREILMSGLSTSRYITSARITTADDGEDRRQPVGKPDLAEERVGEEGAEHDEGALGHVDDARRAVDGDVAKRDERVDAPHRDAGHQKLDPLGHVRPLDPEHFISAAC